VLLNKTQQK